MSKKERTSTLNISTALLYVTDASALESDDENDSTLTWNMCDLIVCLMQCINKFNQPIATLKKDMKDIVKTISPVVTCFTLSFVLGLFNNFEDKKLKSQVCKFVDEMVKTGQSGLLKDMLTCRTCLFPSVDPDTYDFCIVVVTNTSSFAEDVTNCKMANVADSTTARKEDIPLQSHVLSFSIIDYSKNIKYNVEKRLIHIIYLLYDILFLLFKHGPDVGTKLLFHTAYSIMSIPDLEVNVLLREELYRYTNYFDLSQDYTRQNQVSWMMNDIVSLFTTKIDANFILDHREFLESWLRCNNPCYNAASLIEVVNEVMPVAVEKFLPFFIEASSVTLRAIMMLWVMISMHAVLMNGFQ